MKLKIEHYSQLLLTSDQNVIFWLTCNISLKSRYSSLIDTGLVLTIGTNK